MPFGGGAPERRPLWSFGKTSAACGPRVKPAKRAAWGEEKGTQLMRSFRPLGPRAVRRMGRRLKWDDMDKYSVFRHERRKR